MKWLVSVRGSLIRPSAVEAVSISKREDGRFAVYVLTQTDTRYCLGYYDTAEQAEAKRDEVYKAILDYELSCVREVYDEKV